MSQELGGSGCCSVQLPKAAALEIRDSPAGLTGVVLPPFMHTLHLRTFALGREKITWLQTTIPVLDSNPKSDSDSSGP